MEEISKSARQNTTPTPKSQGIIINKVNYSYSITKSKNKKDSLLIILHDPNQKSNIYFTYEAPMEQLIKEIKFLSLSESLDEIIVNLNDIFCHGNAFVEEKNGEYIMEFKVIGIKKKYTIKLIKHEIKQPKEDKSGLESKFKNIEIYLNDLYKKYEALKVIRKKEIKDIVKEVIFDDDIVIKLFEKMKQISSISSSKNNSVPDNKSINSNIDNKIVNKVKVAVNNKENKINNQIDKMQQQLKNNISYVNSIKSSNNNINNFINTNNNDDNYNENNCIIFQVKIDKEDLNKDIMLFNQVRTMDFYYVFDEEQFRTIIDNKNVSIKKGEDHKYYWNFTTTGIHTIKIIFKKKLSQCKALFNDCKKIYKIDCSNFDCSQITDCSWMFCGCYSLTEINFGKLNFALSNDFQGMFCRCQNIEELDLSYFITNKSKSFCYMFSGCSKLKKINLSKFKTINCRNINYMFERCSSLKSIDLSSFDFQNIKKFDCLFQGCSELRRINMSFNNYNFWNFKTVFQGIPNSGSFLFVKEMTCEKILNYLPISWDRVVE